MDSVVHFEIPSDNLERAKKFYTDTFGWQLNDMPEMDYVIAATTPLDEKTHMPKAPGAIGGGMMKRNDIVTAPSFAINVKDIDEAAKKVKAAGGTIIKEKVAVGTMGFIVYFKDTEGNVLSLWQTTGGM
ncbi:MAG: hypothetical protein RL681_743 [Candidatus Parcubacteria bacterium]|jgi:predicted enzyme related to lactoylglutathione lyase